MLSSFLIWNTYKTDLIAPLPYKGGLFFEHRRILATQAIQSTLIARRLFTMALCLHWDDILTIYGLTSYQEIQICIYIWGVLRQKQVTMAGTSNHILQHLWHVTTYYLLLAQHFWFCIFPPYQVIEIFAEDLRPGI